ncbi:MAG: DUF4199 family protein [Alphaproteobacteria bacterium]|nr:DUF4199 family protein [Alphaproteobacteria bacterium]
MIRTILVFGFIAGLIVAVPMVVEVMIWSNGKTFEGGLFLGYATMIVALSAVFVGVKQHRDKRLGGVIKFFPAFGVGLAISAVAGVIYVAGWELSLAVTKYGFAASYSSAMIESARAKGASPEELATITAQMSEFVRNYANPLYRWPMTFIEIFPVGVVISLISAALLRNSRFMPARQVSA